MIFGNRSILRIMALFALILPLLFAAGSSAAQAGDPYAVLDAVNQLRASNGLAPYQMNSALMIIAQNQSNYQASIGTWSHTDSYGTEETQRASAAGYGGGAKIMCDENVAFGQDLSAGGVVDMWLQDAAHTSNLLSNRYLEAGAGAAADAGGRIFYTLDVCYIVGSSLSQPLAQGVVDTPGSAPEPILGVQTVTPGADGSIIHVVQPGESLYSIADAYELTLPELLTLNGLAENSLIRPGDSLIIRAAQPATATLEPSSTPTVPVPTSTHRPTRTPTLRPVASPTPRESLLPSATPIPVPLDPGDIIGNVLPVAIVLLVVAGVVLVVIGAFMKRSS
jgi:LysM repeat protein